MVLLRPLEHLQEELGAGVWEPSLPRGLALRLETSGTLGLRLTLVVDTVVLAVEDTADTQDADNPAAVDNTSQDSFGGGIRAGGNRGMLDRDTGMVAVAGCATVVVLRQVDTELLVMLVLHSWMPVKLLCRCERARRRCRRC